MDKQQTSVMGLAIANSKPVCLSWINRKYVCAQALKSWSRPDILMVTVVFLMIVYSLAFGHFLYWALHIQYLAGSIVRCASAQPVSLLYCAYIYFHSVHYIQLSLNKSFLSFSYHCVRTLSVS